ncbi:MAG: carbohydrate kinase family protein [Candidatus Peribacteraceae bacterium]|nr:carbohydrate kinase family protein [Candidatus Peribacteraceae bacterium]
MSRKVLITGSIAYDVLLASDGSFVDALKGASLDALSVSFVTPHFKRHHGGTGSNIAWNVKLLGGEPLLAGTVGSDGGPYVALLQERGISIEYIETLPDHVTATAIVATDNGERQISFFHPGADSFGSWPDLSDEREHVAMAIVSARSIPQMNRAIEWCVRQKVPLLFDPGQQVHGFSDDELKRALKGSRGVAVNAYESDLLQKRLHLSEQALADQLGFLIVTQGEEGCAVYEKGKRTELPACRAERVVNPTGAGDAFRGGLLTGIAAGWSLVDAAKLGSSIGSFVVEQEGTLLQSIDPEDVWARAQETYGALPKL